MPNPLFNFEKMQTYAKVFLTFARNSLVRDLSFRTNFILQCVTSISWAIMNWAFFKIIFAQGKSIAIGKGTGWNEYEFFIFLGTVWIINSIVQTFFMPNAQEFSELIRTGNLDFALLKPNRYSISGFVSEVKLGVAGQLFSGDRGRFLLHDSTCQPVRKPAGCYSLECFAVYRVHFRRRDDHVFRNDFPFFNERLAGSKSESVHDLVLSDQFLSISDGDLSARSDRLGFMGILYLYYPGPGRCERSSSNFGSALARKRRRCMGELADSTAIRNGSGQFVGVATSIPVGVIQLSQRQQLVDFIDTTAF